jgi:outer membrane protein assembly factor BamA
MGIRNVMFRLPTKVGLILLVLSLAACNTLKNVGEDEYLLTESELRVEGKKIIDPTVTGLITQKPNSKLLGIPLRLHIYNMANPNPDSTFQDWLDRKPNRRQRLTNLLSEKQLNRLGESFLVKGASNWFKDIGEAPTILDSLKSDQSLKRLKAYYGSKGYFNAIARQTTDTIFEKNRAKIGYNVDLGKPFYIDTLNYAIGSKDIDSLFQLAKPETFVHQGDQFDLAHFNQERARLTELFRNSGVWNFQESSINFDILMDTLAISDDQKLDVTLNIDNPKSTIGNRTHVGEYKVNHINNVHIYADFDLANPTSDSLKTIQYKDLNIHYKGDLKYTPKAISETVFFNRDSLYREIDRTRTYRKISSLNNFKYPNIDPIPDSTGTKLDMHIFLAPRPKYSLGFNVDLTHSNINTVGTTFNTSLNIRNVFGGMENLSIGARGTIGLLSDSPPDKKFSSEIGTDVKLSIPRFAFPFIDSERITPAYMLPSTNISAGMALQKNIGLDKQTFNTNYGYQWSPNDKRRNNLDILDIEYIKNLNPDAFFDVYQDTYGQLNDLAEGYDDEYPNPDPDDPLFTDNGDLTIPTGTTWFTNEVLENELGGDYPEGSDEYNEVNRIENRRVRLTENNLIFSAHYTYFKTNREGLTDRNFYSFRSRIESAGNSISLLSNILDFNQNNNNQNLLLNIPYSQYLKAEFDFIKHFRLASPGTVLAFRSFFGIALPYGNSNNIPFSRSYFAGGSNDNRGWQAYSLGPGSSGSLNDFNEANMKIAFNTEYRFPIFGDLKGALFADVGNIWNVLDDETNEKAVFEGIKSLEELAVGSGIGFRYDVSYFIIRLDFGFKTYDPAKPMGNRWFQDYNIKNMVTHIGINYPF